MWEKLNLDGLTLLKKNYSYPQTKRAGLWSVRERRDLSGLQFDYLRAAVTERVRRKRADSSRHRRPALGRQRAVHQLDPGDVATAGRLSPTSGSQDHRITGSQDHRITGSQERRKSRYKPQSSLLRQLCIRELLRNLSFPDSFSAPVGDNSCLPYCSGGLVWSKQKKDDLLKETSQAFSHFCDYKKEKSAILCFRKKKSDSSRNTATGNIVFSFVATF